MRKITLLLLSLYVVITGCQDIEKFTEFNMKYRSAVTVPKSTILDFPIMLKTPDMKTNAESQFAVNDTRKDMIEEIRLTDLILTISSPEEQTFSFLKSITVYINAEGMDEIQVAIRSNIDNNTGSVISLEPTNQDLKDYIKKDKFLLRVETVTDETISKDVAIDIVSDFFVNAKILGL